MAPPRIRLRGLRSPGTPGGYILGRLPGSGQGEVQLLDLNHLRQFGIAAGAAKQTAITIHGWGFYAGGLLNAGELLGTAVYGFNVTFTTGAAGDTFTALVPAAADAQFTLWTPNALLIPTQVGTIDFPAGSAVGTITWSPDPFLLLKGAQLKLYAPAAADLALADVSGLCYGLQS